ncbi:hypothetical protein SAMCCGM7_pC0789 (plasmid) [Sinorhizobium americanum CCGM7]|nr:hypothetical protein SAMCCGM7_pC0789 [Sinorhizobium americanum CCGM7]
MTHQVSHEAGNMIGIITGSLGLLERETGYNERHIARIARRLIAAGPLRPACCPSAASIRSTPHRWMWRASFAAWPTSWKLQSA